MTLLEVKGRRWAFFYQLNTPRKMGTLLLLLRICKKERCCQITLMKFVLVCVSWFTKTEYLEH
ncbi:unnamed protein product [Amoebophrya sp. A25]|nr:unnamed protein product [Amoebophrya sp. A25]|eukprot:GSA25T00024910001.1